MLLNFSLPPWGWWPLAFIGILLVDRAVADAPPASRFRRGWLIGLGLLGPSTFWISAFTPPGYVFEVAFFAVMLGLVLVACPPGAGRRLALPGVWVGFEALKGRWPFGGVPLSELALGQVGGPLAGIARIGGVLAIGFVTVVVGVALSAATERHWRPVLAALGVIVVLLGAAAVAPRGEDTAETVRVALVQGGGPQGTRADQTDERVVFLRHLRASDAVPEGVDLILWPEDVVDVEGPVTSSREGRELAALARKKDATVVVGVVEGDGPDNFRNAAVAWGPDGRPIGRYEKVRRVPFGEYAPLRPLLEPLAGGALPERDAVPGRRSNTLDTPQARVGFLISWEVFFGDRGRDAATGRGRPAEIFANPTNGSSFPGTIVQSQQVASSRLRAIESGRWLVQIAPTGFSEFVSPEGEVHQRTGVSEQAVRVREMPLRRDLTLFLRLGVWPSLAVAALVVGVGWVLARRASEGGGDVTTGMAAPAEE